MKKEKTIIIRITQEQYDYLMQVCDNGDPKLTVSELIRYFIQVRIDKLKGAKNG